MSLTIALSGNSSVLTADFNPPIYLGDDAEYMIGLTNFETFNSIPNVDENNNSFYYGDADNEIIIPVGSYELQDLESYILKHIDKSVAFRLHPNNNTLKTVIRCSERINFQKPNTIGKLLGFENVILQKNDQHESTNTIQILKVNSLCIDCNISTGSYVNGKPVHIIHQFFPIVPAGYKIVERPKNIIYFPVTVKTISNIKVKILDQDGAAVNFRGETISVRLYLKKLNYGSDI